MNENDDVDTFVKNWRLRLDDVILSGLSLPSSVQSALLLAALPPSWQPFISTKSTSTNISIPTLVASISQENLHRRAINQCPSSHTALYIKHPKYNKKSYNKPRSTYQSNNSKFYSRTSKFHDSRDHNKSRFLESFCTNCQRSGHETKDCSRNSNNKGERAHKQEHFDNASHNDYDQNNDICLSDQNFDEDNEDSFHCLYGPLFI